MPARRRPVLHSILITASVVPLAGCRNPLLKVDDERSQFDRYRIARDDYAAPFVTDEFGRRRPNLRGRLLPSD